MKRAFYIYTVVGLSLFSTQLALAQSAPIVVLEYPTFSSEAVDGINSEHPFIEDANHSIKHKVIEAETLSHIITDYYGDSGLDLSVVKMAIVKMNKNAFVRGNANFLFADKVLHLPSLNEIRDLVLGKSAGKGSSSGGGRSDQIYFIGG
tara:strand:+ start:333 stop:779 length:447 start_codon:yes stop_codon:yes gene_type:complete